MDPEVIDQVEGGQVEAPEAPATVPTLRESLAAAVEQHEKSESTGTTPPVKSEPEPSTPDAAAGGKPPVVQAPEKDKTVPDSKEVGAKPASGGDGRPVELKAPPQWKPAVREEWNKIPRAAQEEILRREADSLRLIGSVGPKLRLADEVNQHVAPYLENLKANGVTPSAFIADMFDTVKALTSPNPQDRVEVIANVVLSYGVDLRLLDHVLSQRIQGGPQQIAAQRELANAQHRTQHLQSQLDMRDADESERAIAAFAADPKNEFLGDVRDLMADLIEAGRATNLEDAYAAAIWAHPDTRKILLQREAQARATSKTKRAAAATNAASSVHGTPQGSAQMTNMRPNMSLRESIEAAFDEHSSA
jgi:hypothetical protein